jgi:hypothetical protein
MKKLPNKIKQINHIHILASIFILVLLIVGIAAFIPASGNVAAFIESLPTDIVYNMGQFEFTMDNDYLDMLEFRGLPLVNKGSYINLNGLMARIMGQRFMNEQIRLNNGHLTTYNHGVVQNIGLAAMQITRLYDYQSERGKDFLFVLAPFQVPMHEDIMPTGFKCFSHQASNDLIYLLQSNNVPVLDLREEMVRDNISQSEAFFKTDHHWRPEIGFWAYVKIVENMVQSGLIDPINRRYTDIGEFNVDIYENWFLGSGGKRTGIYFTGVDDFSIIAPKFETYISVNIPSIQFNESGDFSSVVLDYDANRLDFFSANPYDVYGHSDRGFEQYRNDFAPADLRILCIGDSFSNVPFPFLSLVAKECDILDMRQFVGVFWEYINEFDPDIIIILVYADGLDEENTTYDFFGDLQR